LLLEGDTAAFGEGGIVRNRLTNLRFFGPDWPENAAGPNAGFDITDATGGIFTVRLWGRFAPGWCGGFSLGLSRSGINIVRAFARKVGQGRWVAEFQLQPMRADVDLRAVDFSALALEAAEAAEPIPVVLDSCYLDGSSDSGGALFLEVRGPDRVGFLGSLLGHLAALSLFPEEMAIETRGRVAFDCFHLKAAGGRLPSEEAQRALASHLDSLSRRLDKRATEHTEITEGTPAL